jgi:hypothetical protein
MAISPGETDCGLAVRADRSDQGLVDSPCKDHQSSVARLGVGDAQARDEFTLLAHLSKGSGQLHTAAMDDGNLIPVGDEICDGFAGCVENLLILQGGTA